MNDDGMFRMSTQDGLPMRMWIDSCSKCNGRIASHVKPAYSHAVEYVRADVDSVVEEAIGNAVSRAVAAERAACIQIVESCGASYGGFSNVAIEAAVRAIAERAACATKEITLDESVLPKTCPACGAVCIAHDLETELENEGADYDCELGASAVTKA